MTDTRTPSPVSLAVVDPQPSTEPAFTSRKSSPYSPFPPSLPWPAGANLQDSRQPPGDQDLKRHGCPRSRRSWAHTGSSKATQRQHTTAWGAFLRRWNSACHCSPPPPAARADPAAPRDSESHTGPLRPHSSRPGPSVASSDPSRSFLGPFCSPT